MRTRVTLECTECKQRNYNMTKDKKTHPERLVTNQYFKLLKTHPLHKSTKIFAVIPFERKGSENMEKTNKAKKTSWFKELKAEFNRIIWPTKERIAKETAVVVICAIIIGVIVAVLDVGIQYGIQALVG